MSLIKCKECGHEISKKAKTCPNCGANRRTTSILTKVLFVAVASFVWWAILSDSRPTSSAISQQGGPPLLELISFSCTQEHGYIFVTGEVKNISNESMKNVIAVGNFRTKEGQFVKSTDALLEYNPILPGQTSPFKSGGTTNPAITNCNVSFKYLGGHLINYNSKK